MRHAEFTTQVCSIARALEVVGEWWTLLIVREAFFGTEHFDDFEARLGISKNVLSARLSKLVREGILSRLPVPGRGNPVIYRLTAKGQDLLPTIIALMQWGDRWISPKQAPVLVVQKQSGKEVAQLGLKSSAGQRLSFKDLVVLPGPGADRAIKKRFAPRDS
jgi:DNA-binding HxlR family transcriptional regulator